MSFFVVFVLVFLILCLRCIIWLIILNNIGRNVSFKGMVFMIIKKGLWLSLEEVFKENWELIFVIRIYKVNKLEFFNKIVIFKILEEFVFC